MARTQQMVLRGLDEHPEPPQPQKLLIKGSSRLEGRGATTLRIRPTLLKRVEEICTGPLYLVVDVALQELVVKLLALEKPLNIDAASLDPSAEDRLMLAKADREPEKRSESDKRRKAEIHAAAVALLRARGIEGALPSSDSDSGDAEVSEAAGGPVPPKPEWKAARAPVGNRRPAAGAATPKSGGKKH